MPFSQGIIDEEMEILESPSHARGGFVVGGLLAAWSPFIVLIVSSNPFGIVCATACLSLGVACVIHAQLGGLNSNNLEVEVEGQGDQLLEFFSKIGIKGKFSAATAVFLFMFILFIGAFWVLRNTNSEEEKIRSLVPDHKEKVLSTIGTWLGSHHKEVGLDMSAKWENKPPEQFTVNFSGMPMGVLSERDLTKGLEALANDGIEKKLSTK